MEETKKKFNNFKKLFENKSIEEKFQDKEICEILIIKEKNDLKKEIEELNNLLIIPKKSEEQIKTLIEEIITYNSYSLVKQIFGGLKIIFENLNIKDEIISIYEDLDNINKKMSLDDIKKKIEYLSNLNINIKEDNNKLIKFLKFLFQFPNSLKWILQQNENNIKALAKFIIDSDINEHLTLKVINLIEIHNDFEKLKSLLTSKELLKKLYQLLNQKWEKIVNYMNDFNFIENLENKLNKEKNDNFLDNIKNYTFFIEYNNEKQKYDIQ